MPKLRNTSDEPTQVTQMDSANISEDGPEDSSKFDNSEAKVIESQNGLIARGVIDYRRTARRDQRRLIACRLAVVAFILGGWEFVSGRWVDSMFISGPIAICRELIAGVADQDMLSHARITALEALSGFAVGSLAAIALSLVIISIPRGYEVVEPIAMAVYGIPKVALAPLFIIWFGLGISSKIAVSGFMVFFIVFISTMEGLSRTSPSVIQVTRMLGASRAQLLWRVRLPAAVPEIMTSFKLSVPISMIGAIVGEFISSQEGLGFYINRATLGFNTASAFAGVFMLMFIVLTMNALLSFADRRILPWRREQKIVTY